MVSEMTLIDGPVTFTEPASSTRYYYGGAGDVVLVNGVLYIALPYSDPAQGLSNLQSETFIGYTITASGTVTQDNAIDSWFNANNPQNIPALYGGDGLKTFQGPSSKADIGEYFVTLNNNGTATYSVAVVDTSGSSPVVTQVDSITVTPVAKTSGGDGSAHINSLLNGTSLNGEIFEVEGAPASGQVEGTFIIYNSSGTVLFGPSTGFDFTDGKAHVFVVGPWSGNNFAQLVEVWNPTTGLADIQLSLIAAQTAVVTPGWTAATELQSITAIDFSYISPAGAGMLLMADGSDASGRGAFLYDVNDSTSSSGGAGGQISGSLAIYYSGTVIQDAKIVGSGINNEFVIDWVDANGLNIELINSSLQVLETYNIASANEASDVVALGNGDLFVTYRVQSSPTSAVDDFVILSTTLPNASPPANTSADMIMRDSANGDYEIFDLGDNAILGAGAIGPIGTEWQVAGLGDFNGTDTSDMLTRNGDTGQLEVYDISNNNITTAVSMGQVGLEWQVAGFGAFAGTANETDMLMRDSGTGQFEIFDIRNNTIYGAASMGQVGLEWQVAGFGDFSGNPNESDMLMRDSGTGQFEIFDIRNNAIYSAASMGQVGLEWQVAGFGDFSGNPNESDMLMRNTGSGAFEVFDIAHNTITSAASMGQVGLEWSVAGVAESSPASANAQLAQAMASYAPANGALGTSAPVVEGPSALGAAEQLAAQPPHAIST